MALAFSCVLAVRLLARHCGSGLLFLLAGDCRRYDVKRGTVLVVHEVLLPFRFLLTPAFIAGWQGGRLVEGVLSRFPDRRARLNTRLRVVAGRGVARLYELRGSTAHAGIGQRRSRA